MITNYSLSVSGLAMLMERFDLFRGEAKNDEKRGMYLLLHEHFEFIF